MNVKSVQPNIMTRQVNFGYRQDPDLEAIKANPDTYRNYTDAVKKLGTDPISGREPMVPFLLGRIKTTLASMSNRSPEAQREEVKRIFHTIA